MRFALIFTIRRFSKFTNIVITRCVSVIVWNIVCRLVYRPSSIHSLIDSIGHIFSANFVAKWLPFMVSIPANAVIDGSPILVHRASNFDSWAALFSLSFVSLLNVFKMFVISKFFLFSFFHSFMWFASLGGLWFLFRNLSSFLFEPRSMGARSEFRLLQSALENWHNDFRRLLKQIEN